MSNVLDFAPRGKGGDGLKAIFDYRSGIRVLAHDEVFDIAEPFASEVEARMMERRHGFGHIWPVSKLSPGLLAELRRIRLPTIIMNGVLVLPSDFRVVTELEPTVESMAAADLEVAA